MLHLFLLAMLLGDQSAQPVQTSHPIQESCPKPDAPGAMTERMKLCSTETLNHQVLLERGNFINMKMQALQLQFETERRNQADIAAAINALNIQVLKARDAKEGSTVNWEAGRVDPPPPPPAPALPK